MTPERKQELMHAAYGAGMVAGGAQLLHSLILACVYDEDEGGLAVLMSGDQMKEISKMMEFVVEICATPAKT